MKKLHTLSFIPMLSLLWMMSCSSIGDNSFDSSKLTRYTWETTKILKSGIDYAENGVYVYNFDDDGTYRVKLTIGALSTASGGVYIFDEEARTLKLTTSPTYYINELSRKKLILESSSELYEFKALKKVTF